MKKHKSLKWVLEVEIEAKRMSGPQLVGYQSFYNLVHMTLSLSTALMRNLCPSLMILRNLNIWLETSPILQLGGGRIDGVGEASNRLSWFNIDFGFKVLIMVNINGIVSKKIIFWVEWEETNLMVGWKEFNLLRNSINLFSPCVQIKNISSIYQIHMYGWSSMGVEPLERKHWSSMDPINTLA